jgi:geranylgeranyl diphosphate synthase type I
MWKERQAELLKKEIEVLLDPLSNIAGFCDLIREPLTKARRGLAPNIPLDRPWPLIPLMVCESICGRYEHAIPAAAALQLLQAAGDVFDDIEDADSSDSLSAKLGNPLATNIATTLLILSEKATTRLKERGVADALIIRIINMISSYYTCACAGQHLDLSFNSKMSISLDQYFKVMEMKSASQVECACTVGALLAKARKELVDIFAKFGYNLGISSQISNDIQGYISNNGTDKHTITLPIVYALNQTDNQIFDEIRHILKKPSLSVHDIEQIKDMLFHTGAIHFAIIKMEYYKQIAKDILVKAETLGVNIERLKIFLD